MILHTMKQDPMMLLKEFSKHLKNFKEDLPFKKKKFLQVYWDKTAWTLPYLKVEKVGVFLFILLRNKKKRLIKTQKKKWHSSIVFTEQWKLNPTKERKTS